MRRRLAAGLLGTGLGLALAEAGVRGLGLAPDPWVRHVHVERADKRAGVDLYPDDPYGILPLDLRKAADLARVGQAGLSPGEQTLAHTPRGVLGIYDAGLCREERVAAPVEVLVVGDSFTEGQGVGQDQAWPRRLEQRLGRRSLNCGRRGFDVEDVAAFLERQLPDRAPRWVLYGMLPNDPVQSEAYAARQRYLDDWIVLRSRTVAAPSAPPWWQPALWRFGTQRLEGRRLGRATRDWYAGMAGPDNAAGWQATLAAVERMARASEAAGARFAVVLWPILADLDSYPFAALHQTIGRDIRALGVPVLDLTGALSGLPDASLWVHPVDHHPSPLAHRLGGDAVAAWLADVE